MGWIVEMPPSHHGDDGRCFLPDSEKGTKFGAGSVWECGCGKRHKFHGWYPDPESPDRPKDDWQETRRPRPARLAAPPATPPRAPSAAPAGKTPARQPAHAASTARSGG